MAKREADFDVAGLQSSIEHSKKTIDALEQAISQERTKIADYRKMIETLETKRALSEGVVLDASA